MPQVSRTPLAEQAADLLLERIRAGEWALGAKLPSEAALGPQLGVGRSTVREAIRRLAGQGVLATRQGAGVFVASLEVRDDWNVVLLRADVTAVVEARIALEVEAAALAAQRRTPAQLRALRAAAAAREVATGSLEDHVDADIAFHRCILVAAQSPLLLELFDALTPRVRRAMVDMLRHRGVFGSAPDHAAHVDVLEAIAGRDGTTAAALARAHLHSLKIA